MMSIITGHFREHIRFQTGRSQFVHWHRWPGQIRHLNRTPSAIITPPLLSHIVYWLATSDSTPGGDMFLTGLSETLDSTGTF